MAKSEIHVNHRLPPICMCCGEPATINKYQHFKATNVTSKIWQYFSSFLPLPKIVSFAIGDALKRIGDYATDVPVVLCKRHTNHWSWQNFLVFMVAIPWFAGFIAWLMIPPQMMPTQLIDPVSSWSAFGLFSVICATTLAIVFKRTIRAKSISPTSVLLVGLSPRFVELLDPQARKQEARNQDFFSKENILFSSTDS